MPSFIDLAGWPLWGVVVLFAGATVVIATAGTLMTRLADRLADLTGMGEAIFGAVLLGGSTSLPGIITSVVTAYQGYPELAISNAVGGIAAQTTFLAVADLTYRGANLEHAAASVENLIQGALLTALLAIPLLAMAAPPVTLWGVHPASLGMLAAYVFGLRLVATAQRSATWQPYQTTETKSDEPDEEQGSAGNMGVLWLQFAGFALLTAVAGFMVAQSGIALVTEAGLSETVVGGLFTAISTSLPELVTSIAAVRRGALTLAVGGIIGGNAFDVLFIAFSDAAYREGSIYHAIVDDQLFIVALTMLLTSILLLGLIRREKHGIGGIGFESFLVLLCYVGGFLVVTLT